MNVYLIRHNLVSGSEISLDRFAAPADSVDLPRMGGVRLIFTDQTVDQLRRHVQGRKRGDEFVRIVSLGVEEDL